MSEPDHLGASLIALVSCVKGKITIPATVTQAVLAGIRHTELLPPPAQDSRGSQRTMSYSRQVGQVLRLLVSSLRSGAGEGMIGKAEGRSKTSEGGNLRSYDAALEDFLILLASMNPSNHGHPAWDLPYLLDLLLEPSIHAVPGRTTRLLLIIGYASIRQIVETPEALESSPTLSLAHIPLFHHGTDLISYICLILSHMCETSSPEKFLQPTMDPLHLEHNDTLLELVSIEESTGAMLLNHVLVGIGLYDGVRIETLPFCAAGVRKNGNNTSLSWQDGLVVLDQHGMTILDGTSTQPVYRLDVESVPLNDEGLESLVYTTSSQETVLFRHIRHQAGRRPSLVVFGITLSPEPNNRTSSDLHLIWWDLLDRERQTQSHVSEHPSQPLQNVSAKGIPRRSHPDPSPGETMHLWGADLKSCRWVFGEDTYVDIKKQDVAMETHQASQIIPETIPGRGRRKHAQRSVVLSSSESDGDPVNMESDDSESWKKLDTEDPSDWADETPAVVPRKSAKRASDLSSKAAKPSPIAPKTKTSLDSSPLVSKRFNYVGSQELAHLAFPNDASVYEDLFGDDLAFMESQWEIKLSHPTTANNWLSSELRGGTTDKTQAMHKRTIYHTQGHSKYFCEYRMPYPPFKVCQKSYSDYRGLRNHVYNGHAMDEGVAVREGLLEEDDALCWLIHDKPMPWVCPDCHSQVLTFNEIGRHKCRGVGDDVKPRGRPKTVKGAKTSNNGVAGKGAKQVKEKVVGKKIKKKAVGRGGEKARKPRKAVPGPDDYQEEESEGEDDEDY